MAVKAFGADAVAIADIKRDNLDLAMKLGADVALNPDRDAAPQEVATWMRAALPPHGPDMVIDCAGFEPTLQVYSALLATLLPLLALQDVCGRAWAVLTVRRAPTLVSTPSIVPPMQFRCLRRQAQNTSSIQSCDT